MLPNDKWDDFALSNQFEHIDNFIRATAALPNEMVKMAAAIEENTRRVTSHHKWIEELQTRSEHRYGEIRREVAAEIREVKDLCERIGTELRNDARERFRARVSLMVAIIGAAAIIAAAIIAGH